LLSFGLRLGLRFPRGISSERKSFSNAWGERRLVCSAQGRRVLKFVTFRRQEQMREATGSAQPMLSLGCMSGSCGNDRRMEKEPAVFCAFRQCALHFIVRFLELACLGQRPRQSVVSEDITA